MDDTIGTLHLELTADTGTGQRRDLAQLAIAGLGTGAERAPGPEPVVLLRRARLRLDVAGTPGLDRAAVEAGRALPGAMMSRVEQVSHRDDVVVYPSVAEYLITFLSQLLAGRPADSWTFAALSVHRRGTLSDTVLSIARHERDAWPRVVDLLRSRGLLATLLARCDGRVRQLIQNGHVDSRRALGAAEGWPLFLAGWEIALAHRGAGPHPPAGSRPASPPAPRAGDRSVHPAAPTFARFLAEAPAAPESWARPAALARWVARATAWIRRDLGLSAIPVDGSAVRSAVARFAWLDAKAFAEALTGALSSAPPHGGTSTRAGGPQVGPPLSAGGRSAARWGGRSGPRVNRTRAVRVLDIAEWLFPAPGRLAGMTVVGGGDDTPSEVTLLEAVVETLGRAPVVLDREAVRAFFSDGGAALGAPGGAMSSTLQRLDEAEGTRLLDALLRGAKSQPAPGLATRYVGLFLLARPLIDLGLPGLAVRRDIPIHEVQSLLLEMADLIGAPDGDPAPSLFAAGPQSRRSSVGRSTDASSQTLVDSLLDRAQAVGLPDSTNGSHTPAARLLDVACAQFVRWLRGFQDSSTAFVLERFVIRPGRLETNLAPDLSVEWPGSGYETVLDMAGYLDPLERVPWWPEGGIRWQR